MKPLIIWDFDGVIADTEKLWVQVWCDTLKKEKNIVLSKEQELELLVGVSDKTKKERLEQDFPMLKLDEDFMQKINLGEIYMGMHFMKAIPDVEEVFADSGFDHCIATGATKEQHAWKMTQFKWLEKYLTENDYFTADMVKNGKPAPDLFLLAARKKKHTPDACIVIGDSLKDLSGAKAAKIKCIAFVGAEGNDTLEYRKKCIDAGAAAVCSTMNEVHQVVSAWAENLNELSQKD